MVIEKLCCGDGSLGRNRRQLRHGQMYAAPNLQSGIESYSAIDIRSVVLFDHGWRYPRYELCVGELIRFKDMTELIRKQADNVLDF